MTSESQIWIYHLSSKYKSEPGFKLHVSIDFLEYQKAVADLIPKFIDLGISFKYAANSSILRDLNAGIFGYTQVGKFATIYPDHQERIEELALLLDEWSRDYRGPRVPSDRRLHDKSNVYFRFWDPTKDLGDIESRLPGAFKCLPDPFQATSSILPLPKSIVLINVIRQTAKGGVYHALDLTSVNEVIIKEGRFGVDRDVSGQDARDRIVAEYTALRAVVHLQFTPAAYHLWQYSDIAIISIEKIDGCSLKILLEKGWQPKSSTIIFIMNKLKLAVEAFHQLGWVVGDLSPDNVMLNLSDYQLKLIDLEYAHRIDETPPIEPKGTPGFMPMEQLLQGVDADWYAVERIGKALSNPDWYKGLLADDASLIRHTPV